jgi:hypothetical protein
VTKTRLEYERCLEQFTLARSKHEEQKGKGSKRSDEYRDRYMKVGAAVSLFPTVFLISTHVKFRIFIRIVPPLRTFGQLNKFHLEWNFFAFLSSECCCQYFVSAFVFIISVPDPDWIRIQSGP